MYKNMLGVIIYLKRISATSREQSGSTLPLSGSSVEGSGPKSHIDRSMAGGEGVSNSLWSPWNSNVKSNFSAMVEASCWSGRSDGSCRFLFAPSRAAATNLQFWPKTVKFILSGTLLDFPSIWLMTENKDLEWRPFWEDDMLWHRSMRAFALQTEERMAVKCFWRSNSLSGSSLATSSNVRTWSWW